MSEPLILKLKRENKENQQKIQQNTDNIELLKQENIELKAKDIELEEENNSWSGNEKGFTRFYYI